MTAIHIPLFSTCQRNLSEFTNNQRFKIKPVPHTKAYRVANTNHKNSTIATISLKARQR